MSSPLNKDLKALYALLKVTLSSICTFFKKIIELYLKNYGTIDRVVTILTLSTN